MSVTKRVYEYTDKSGRTKTYTVWRARVWTYPPHGERRQVEEEFDRKTDAEEWEREQRGTARGRTIDVERLTLAESGLWERAEPVLRGQLAPKTFDHYRRGWDKRVLPTLGKVKVGALTVGDVERAQTTWAAAGAGPSTVRQARNALSAVLRVAVRDGLLRANPARSAQRPAGDASARDSRRVGRPLTPEQLRTLVSAIRVKKGGGRYATIADLMGSAGLRYGEAAALKIGQVDLKRGVMQIKLSVTEVAIDENIELKSGHWREGNLVWGPPKGGERTVPVPLHLVEALDELIAGRPRSALVIESEREKVLRVRTFRRKVDWTKLVADLGFDGFRIHDLRATAVTNLLAAGVPPHVVRDIVGHKDLQVTSLYARAHDDALSLAAAALMAYQGRA